MKRWLWLVPALAVFVLGGIGLFRSHPAAEIGRAAPPFTLETLDDPAVRMGLADLRGRHVVVNFWASWCEPCRDEAETLADAAREHEPDVAFLGVTILDGRSAALAFKREFDIPYPSLMDQRGETARRYGVTGVPETVFIDPEGTIVGSFIGAISADQLDRLLADLQALAPGQTLDITGRGETRPVP